VERSTRWPQGERPQPISLAESRTGGSDIRLRDLTWIPAGRRRAVLDGLDLDVPAGQRVIVAGPSGAGKSTLLRAMAGLLLTSSHGDLSGQALIGGDAAGTTPGRVALLVQDPLAGVVAETVGRDVAFGLENQRVARAEIWPRVRSALQQSGFPYECDHPTAALSGGEIQRLVLAGALALDSAVLLLDEPTSMLDPESATAVREAVRQATTRRGSTLVVVEHRLEPWLDFADRLIVLDGTAGIVADGRPADVLEEHGSRLAALGVWVPGQPRPTPVQLDPALVEPWADPPSILVEAHDVSVSLRSPLAGRRRTETTLALQGVDAVMRAGSALAVTGRSGAGKSTLVAVLAGLERPSAGVVEGAVQWQGRRGGQPWRWRSRDLARRLSWLPQLPELGIVATTVFDEVMATGRAVGIDEDRSRRRAGSLLEALGLSQLANASPYRLSGGEQRRLMVAAVMAHGPAGTLFDEPTVGQDRLTWAAVVGAISSARSAGAGIVVASHDDDAVAAVADVQIRLANGRIV
jgi:energy-coupling factor transporter ATP-binding protein EcfA2